MSALSERLARTEELVQSLQRDRDALRLEVATLRDALHQHRQAEARHVLCRTVDCNRVLSHRACESCEDAFNQAREAREDALRDSKPGPRGLAKRFPIHGGGQ